MNTVSPWIFLFSTLFIIGMKILLFVSMVNRDVHVVHTNSNIVKKQWTKKQKQMSNSTSEPEVTHRTCHGIVSIENMGTRKEVSNSMQQWVRVLSGFCPAWVCCCRRSYRINLIISSDAYEMHGKNGEIEATMLKLWLWRREKKVWAIEMVKKKCENYDAKTLRW